MTYTTVYDLANDSIGLQFPLIGLALILAGVAMKWGFGRSGRVPSGPSSVPPDPRSGFHDHGMVTGRGESHA